MTLVHTATDERGVCIVTMDDAAGRNALSEPLVAELQATLTAVPPSAHVVMLRGRPDVFCAGASRELLGRMARGEIEPVDLVLPRGVLGIDVPVIAAMEGHAVGGGLALGLCADITVLARESRYGCSFMDLGFTPGMGITRLLEAAMPPAVAHELLYTAELRRGRDLVGQGFNHVVPREQVRELADQIASRIADKPLHALRLLKRALAGDKRRRFEEALVAESLMHEVCFAAPATATRIEERYVE